MVFVFVISDYELNFVLKEERCKKLKKIDLIF